MKEKGHRNVVVVRYFYEETRGRNRRPHPPRGLRGFDGRSDDERVGRSVDDNNHKVGETEALMLLNHTDPGQAAAALKIIALRVSVLLRFWFICVTRGCFGGREWVRWLL